MNRLRLVLVSSFVATTSAAMFLAACSSDTSVPTIPEVDAGDAGDADASVTPPGDKDSGPTETDGGTDSGPDDDAGDAGEDDAGHDAGTLDAGTTLDDYRNLVADTLCTSVSRCCFGTTPISDGGVVDGGTYDPTECLQLGRDLGFEDTNKDVKWVSSERVELDSAKAAECLSKIKALSCSLTGAELRAARTVCFAAIKGKQATAAPCSASIECAEGYCKPVDPTANAVSPNAGVCTKLAGAGGGCGAAFSTGTNDIDQQYAEQVCSTRNSGDTGRHCDSYDYGTFAYNTRDNWKCVASNVPNGGGCSSTSWCATGICNDQTFTCQDPVELLGHTCPKLLKDGGAP